jgi:hypothetical protein
VVPWVAARPPWGWHCSRQVLVESYPEECISRAATPGFDDSVRLRRRSRRLIEAEGGEIHGRDLPVCSLAAAA